MKLKISVISLIFLESNRNFEIDITALKMRIKSPSVKMFSVIFNYHLMFDLFRRNNFFQFCELILINKIFASCKKFSRSITNSK